ncbi:hypothetical protein PINS_up016223 [Pythium insidiosum]|nr:hypothetical protein PINS_up016223 [Pythium insidiosum]
MAPDRSASMTSSCSLVLMRARSRVSTTNTRRRWATTDARSAMTRSSCSMRLSSSSRSSSNSCCLLALALDHVLVFGRLLHLGDLFLDVVEERVDLTEPVARLADLGGCGLEVGHRGLQMSPHVAQLLLEREMLPRDRVGESREVRWREARIHDCAVL